MNKDLAIRLLYEDETDSERETWKFVKEEIVDSYEYETLKRQIFQLFPDDVYYEISFLYSSDYGINDDSISFRQVRPVSLIGFV